MQKSSLRTGGHGPTQSSERAGWFATTHWSVVWAAGRDEGTRGRAAREELFRACWYPLYAYLRRMGRSAEDAEDLVQGFFLRCLEKDYLRVADEAKGRFRSFLLMAFKRYIANEEDRRRARKRGGGRLPVSLDGVSVEERYGLEPGGSFTPDQLFERRWALTLLERVLGRLREEQAAAGHGDRFGVLQGVLTSDDSGPSYVELGRRLGLSEGAVKVAVHRLRRRYRQLLEEEIGQTVGSPEEIADERRYLLSVLSR